MGYVLDFTDKAKEDVEFFKKSGDKIVLKKVNSLLEEILDTPFSGVGKPEALKHELSGYWSRRINREHRLIYKVLDHSVVIYSLRGHYK